MLIKSLGYDFMRLGFSVNLRGTCNNCRGSHTKIAVIWIDLKLIDILGGEGVDSFMKAIVIVGW
jgi:hypothetical protein